MQIKMIKKKKNPQLAKTPKAHNSIDAIHLMQKPSCPASNLIAAIHLMQKSTTQKHQKPITNCYDLFNIKIHNLKTTKK